MTCQGSSLTVEARPSPRARPTADANASRAGFQTAAAAATAAASETPIRTCSQERVPITGMSARLNASAPTIEPAVLIAYTSPDNRAGSSPGAAAAARPRGKLAPHNNVAGKMAQTQRARSSSKLNQGSSESHGSTGQKGSECASEIG